MTTTAGSRNAHFVCRLSELADGTGAAFQIETPDGPRAIFVVRKGQKVRGYVNACPHQGTPLDWRPRGFMSEDGRHIQCATHGALFEIDDGGCIAGPCAGDSLTAVALTINDDGVVTLASGKSD